MAIGDIEEVGGVDCIKCPWHQRTVSIESGEYMNKTGVCPDGSDRQVVNMGAVQRTHRTSYNQGYAVIEIGAPSEGGNRAMVSKVCKDGLSGGGDDMDEGELSIDSDLHAFIETAATREKFGSKAKGILSQHEREAHRKKSARKSSPALGAMDI